MIIFFAALITLISLLLVAVVPFINHKATSKNKFVISAVVNIPVLAFTMFQFGNMSFMSLKDGLFLTACFFIFVTVASLIAGKIRGR